MNTTKADIENTISRIYRRFNFKIEVDWMAGRPRILTEGNGRYLSPRGTKSEIALWLSGFEEGLDVFVSMPETENVK